MSKQYSIRKAYILNSITAGMVLFSVLWMFSGIMEGPSPSSFTVSRWGMLKFYTVDSNILMGIVALIAARKEKEYLSGRVSELSPSVYILKLAGVVGVTLTMLVTTCFLAPTARNGWLSCFSNSNFFLHLLNPLISIYTFLRYERTSEIPRKHTFTGIVSMLIYAALYLVNCLLHMEGDTISGQYDWYGFFLFGRISVYIVLPIILLVTYAISYCLWRLNRRTRG